MENLMLWGFYILTFYAFLPGLISRTFGFRVFKKGHVKNEISLTFDDGPDPQYTPLLLDLLAKYNAKATFFVVGVHAEKHPELLRRMADEGHIIGIHNYVHKTNWLMRPKEVRRQINLTSDIIRKATRTTPVYYRPPWGIVNLFDFSRLGYLQIILWSAMFGDWRRRVGVRRLTKRMLKKLRPGEVLLLHDSGVTLGADREAPVNMLQALEVYLQAGIQSGFRFVTVTEMIKLTDRHFGRKPGKTGMVKRMLVSAWLGWERLFHLMFRLEPVGDGGGMFYYRVRPYHGKTLHLQDGRQIHNHDKIVELHFDNERLFKLMNKSKSLVQVAIAMIREVEKALPLIASQLAMRPDYRELRGIYGISLISRGSEGFGFTVLELPQNLFGRLTQFYLKLLLGILHPTGMQRINATRSSLTPKIMAMSIEEFKRRYSPDSGSEDPTHQNSADVKSGLKKLGREMNYGQDQAAKELVP